MHSKTVLWNGWLGRFGTMRIFEVSSPCVTIFFAKHKWHKIDDPPMDL